MHLLRVLFFWWELLNYWRYIFQNLQTNAPSLDLEWIYSLVTMISPTLVPFRWYHEGQPDKIQLRFQIKTCWFTWYCLCRMLITWCLSYLLQGVHFIIKWILHASSCVSFHFDIDITWKCTSIILAEQVHVLSFVNHRQ